MLCSNWNSESHFCSIKSRIINPEEVTICEECLDYKTSKKEKKLFCKSCEVEFELTENRKVLIKGKEFTKCPRCGEVLGIDRDNKWLS